MAEQQEVGAGGLTEARPLGRRTVRLGAIVGIDVRVHWSWSVIAVLLTSTIAMYGLPVLQPDWAAPLRWGIAGVIALLFFASLVLHELAHAVVARRRGVPVLDITLFLLGGVAALGGEPRRPRDEFAIAVVGPLASFALMFLFGGLYFVAALAQNEVAATISFYVATMNLAVGTFNLLPGYPLDGGRILRSVVWWFRQNLDDATRIAGWVGRVVAVGLMALGLWMVVLGGIGGAWMAFLGFFLWSAAMPRVREAT